MLHKTGGSYREAIAALTISLTMLLSLIRSYLNKIQIDNRMINDCPVLREDGGQFTLKKRKVDFQISLPMIL